MADDSNNFDGGPINIPTYAPEDVLAYSSKPVLISYVGCDVVSLSKKFQRGDCLGYCVGIILGK